MPMISYDDRSDMVRIDGFHKGAVEIYRRVFLWAVVPETAGYLVRFSTREGGEWNKIPMTLINPKIHAIFQLVKEKAPSFHQGPRHIRYLAF